MAGEVKRAFERYLDALEARSKGDTKQAATLLAGLIGPDGPTPQIIANLDKFLAHKTVLGQAVLDAAHAAETKRRRSK